MTGERVVRRLAAILAADVVGYSRLMGRDESGTLARLKAHRTERLEPTLARHGGRLVKLTGDGALVEFSSAVDALGAAIEFQQTMGDANQDQPGDTRIVFRIGLHLGDLIVDGDDLYGDGVNVAARLEAEAPAGGILVSRAVREAVDGRLKAKLHALGELSLKNIERPIRAFRVEWEAADWKATATPAPKAVQDEPTTPAATTPTLALPDKPSIAVLPFQNMSGDSEQEYFADGMVEDIITALSRFRSLFVIARNSTFTYKGRAVDVRTVTRELGVRYVVEGSVRKVGNRIRITAQLIDATNGHHVWSERYDRQIEDIFEVQDEISGRIVSAINVELIDVEAKRAGQKRSGRLDVWESYHRGVRQYDRSTRDSNDEARRLFEAAIAVDPDHAMAHAGLACTFMSDVGVGLTDDPTGAVARGLRLAQRAVDLDGNDALAHAVLGRLQTWAGETQIGIAELEKAIALNPNLAYGFRLLGEVYLQIGRSEDALRALDTGIRLSPRDPGLWVFFLDKSIAHARLGDHANAIEFAQRAIQERPDQFWPYLISAIALALAGRLDDARVQTEAARSLRADLSLPTVEKIMTNMKFVHTKRTIDLLRLAGLPD